jgi:hypothetical protein
MTTKSFFYVVVYSFGENPVLKNSMISTKYSSTICIENSCASGKFIDGCLTIRYYPTMLIIETNFFHHHKFQLIVAQHSQLWNVPVFGLDCSFMKQICDYDPTYQLHNFLVRVYLQDTHEEP